MSSSVILRVDLTSDTPAYRQIVDGLRLLFVGGEIRPGETLPTVRSLALDLGVHFSTVAEAYRILSAEGWLELRRRHGAVVTERNSPAPAPHAPEEFSTKLRQLIAQVRAEGLPVRIISQELERLADELGA